MPGGDARLGASILDAHPYPTILVDRARRVVHANAAAAAALGAKAGQDVATAMGCTERAAGCGTGGRCSRCGIDRVLASALAGDPARSRTFLLRTGPHGEPADLHVLASAAPLARGGSPHAVLVIQDVNDLLTDPDVLRVCAGCGRIEEEAEWYPLDRYLDDRLGLEAGDALCPRCAGLPGR